MANNTAKNATTDAKAKKGSDPNAVAMQALSLDLEFKNRQLAEQAAEAAAQTAYQNKRMELIEKGQLEQGASQSKAQLEQNADQFAKTYALQIGQLEFQKSLGAAQLGLTAQAQQHSQQMDLLKTQYEQDFNEAALTGFLHGVPTLDRYKADQANAEQAREFDVGSSGYQNGQATLARDQFERGLGETQRTTNIRESGYINGQETLDRQKFDESQRQFDTNTIMNSPRGPADYVAYIKKMRALEGQGLAPGLLSDISSGGVGRQSSLSSGGQATGPVASNLDLAVDATNRKYGTPTDPWALKGLIGAGDTQNVTVSSAPSQTPAAKMSDPSFRAGVLEFIKEHPGATTEQAITWMNLGDDEAHRAVIQNGIMSGFAGAGAPPAAPSPAPSAPGQASGPVSGHVNDSAQNGQQVFSGGSSTFNEGGAAAPATDPNNQFAGLWAAYPAQPSSAYTYTPNTQGAPPSYSVGQSSNQAPRQAGAPSNQAFSSQPGGYDPWSSARGAASSPYSEGVKNMFGAVNNTGATPKVQTGDQWNMQAWRKLSPTEQAYSTGLVESEAGQTPDDFQWSMKNAVSGQARSKTATWAGM